MLLQYRTTENMEDLAGHIAGDIRREEKGGIRDIVSCGAYYHNQRQELVGTIRATQCRFIPPEKQAVHFDRESKTEMEIKSPDLLAYERQRRGADPRYWEDIAIGEEMTPVLEKGLLTMTGC